MRYGVDLPTYGDRLHLECEGGGAPGAGKQPEIGMGGQDQPSCHYGSRPADMPLQVTRLEKRILSILSLLIILGLIALAIR
jgi:hypothetical protein